MPTIANDCRSAFHWNAGAWFGVQLGGTCWLLTGALQLFPEAPPVSFLWIGAFLLANGWGLVLWRQRQRLQMYPAVQFFLLGLAALSFGSLALADWSGQLASLTAGSPHPRWIAYGTLLIIPGLMALFYLWERLGRARARH